MTADLSRRRFMLGCGAASVLLAGAARAGTEQRPLTAFERVSLVDAAGEHLGCEALGAEQEYVFFYPYASTPCFLLNLAGPTARSVELYTHDGRPYTWQGGVGHGRSVVAFSAICAHKLSHPSPAVSFIGYRRQPVGFLGDDNRVQRRAGVIQCCSEHSIYDPAQGAKVVSGPAPQPLAAIALSEDDGRLHAEGVYGGDVFERFFERFGFRLALEMGQDDVRRPVTGTAQVLPIDEYTRQRIQC
jgi:Rieske Fe-S protein